MHQALFTNDQWNCDGRFVPDNAFRSAQCRVIDLCKGQQRETETEQSNQTEAIRYLAEYTETFRDAMSRMAVEYNANIITGSMPLAEGDKIYNKL